MQVSKPTISQYNGFCISSVSRFSAPLLTSQSMANKLTCMGGKREGEDGMHENEQGSPNFGTLQGYQKDSSIFFNRIHFFIPFTV